MDVQSNSPTSDSAPREARKRRGSLRSGLVGKYDHVTNGFLGPHTLPSVGNAAGVCGTPCV
jgi:hypothetical protein